MSFRSSKRIRKPEYQKYSRTSCFSRIKSFLRKNILWLCIFGGVFFGVVLLLLFIVRFGLFNYKKSESHPHLFNSPWEAKRISHIIHQYSDKTFGFDISHYQERQAIDWENLWIEDGRIPLEFVVMRASMGERGKDRNFHHFWDKAKEKNLVRGAYHFYRPDEDPVIQAKSYLSSVHLQSGDLAPILDLEKFPSRKSYPEYINDVKIWLKIVEQSCGTRPILYTYYYYYRDYLANDFGDYPLWLANYNYVEEPSPYHRWMMWQFTEKGISTGIDVKVDLNLFNGSLWQLKRKYTLK